LFFILMMATVLFLLIRPTREVIGQQAAKAVQWEFKVLYSGGLFRGNDADETASKLTVEYNNLAADGWDYAGEAPGGNYMAVFKRPKL